MMKDIQSLEAEYANAKKASDDAYKAMWANKSDKSLVKEFESLFLKCGNARRALESATGKIRDDISVFAKKKNLEHGARIEKEMNE